MLVRVIEKENISDDSSKLLCDRECKAMKWLVEGMKLEFDEKECNKCEYGKEKCPVKDRDN